MSGGGFDVMSSTFPYVSTWCQGRFLPNPYAIRILWPDFLMRPAGTIFPTFASYLSGVMPAVSSEFPGSPGTNVLTSPRRQRWMAHGCFVLSDNTSSGYVMAPDNELKIREPGNGSGTYRTVTLATSGTVKYVRDPWDLCALGEAAIRAQSLLTGKYKIDYDDERFPLPHFGGGASKTLKFRIRRTDGGTFDVQPKASHTNSALAAMGYDGTLNTETGATSYTADAPSCGTEEWLVFDLDDVTNRGLRALQTEAFVDEFRYLVLVDPPAGVRSGNPSCRVYETSALTDLDRLPDSSGSWTSANYRVLAQSDNVSIQFGVRPRPFVLTNEPRPRYIVVDLYALYNNSISSTSDTARGYRYLKIKFQGAPGYPLAERVSLGRVIAAPGFTPRWNILNASPTDVQQRIDQSINDRGTMRGRYRAPQASLQGTWGKNNPLSDLDRLLMEAMIRMSTPDGYASQLLAGAHQLTYVFDPGGYMPATGQQYEQRTAVAGYGALTLGGFAQLTQDQHAGQMSFIEEAA